MGDVISQYVKKEANATVVLSFGGMILGVRPSLVVATFSSRGPNVVMSQILKPYVIGLGVNILAGWSEAVGPTGLDSDSRKTEYNIMSEPTVLVEGKGGSKARSLTLEEATDAILFCRSIDILYLQ